MWIEYNPNPVGRKVGDCAVRAVAKALETTWEKAHVMLDINAIAMGDMPTGLICPKKMLKSLNIWLVQQTIFVIFLKKLIWKMTIVWL